MSSLITRGYYKYDRIITRGYGTGWLGLLRAEILRFVSKFYRVVEFDSAFRVQ
jgi:hypothetical protein